MALQKKTSHDAIELLAATTPAAGAVDTAGSAVRLPGMVNGFAFILDVTAAATDVGDTLDVQVETKLDGTNWVPVAHFTQVLGNGGAKRYVAKIVAGLAEDDFEDSAALGASAVRHLLGDEWRVAYVQVDGNSDAAFTFSVVACPM